jgi:cytochrome P450 PksS
MPASLPKFDLFGPRFKANAYAVYAQMREQAPVYRRVNATGTGATCYITRYDDAVTVLRDHHRFVKDVRNAMTPAARAALPAPPPLMRLLSDHMLNADGPDHTRLRALVNQAFTARRVEQLQPRIQTLAHDLIDAMQRRDPAGVTSLDLIEGFAYPLPVMVIAELLGVPSRDYARFRAWSNALIAPSADPGRNTKKLARARQLMQDFITYLGDLFAERRRRPRDDLITSLLQAEEAGDRLDENELYSMVLLLVVVGHETTVNLIGNGTLALLHHPEQADRLASDPALLRPAIEEMLRYDSPVERAPMRFAAEDVFLSDTLVRRGDAVSIVLGSANHDGRAFTDPDTFDPSRLDNRHLSFGLGAHYCLGAPLARLEGRIAFQTLLTRLPGLRLAFPEAGLVWRTQPIMRGLRRLPVTWTPPR